MKKRESAEQEFDNYFTEIYGARWSSLRSALLSSARKATLQNPFGEPYQAYTLDEASLGPVKLLEIQAGERVADFCASPGGKALSAIFTLRGQADWYCNDLSPARVTRLKAVFHDCLPKEILAKVRFSRGDASLWGRRYPGEFDKILVDAPCSGERHLLQSAKELARWSAKGSKRLAVRQNALLCSAIDCLRVGGRAVYSTCSISPLENDGVIDKLLKSREGLFRIVPVAEAMGEATRHGWIVLPDTSGCGPIYSSVLEKTAD